MCKKLLYAISEGQGSFDLSWVSPKLTNWPVYITSHHHNVRVNSLQANFWHWEVVAILFCCSNNMASFWKNPSRLVSIFSWMMLSDWILSRDWWYGPHCLGHKNYPVKFQPFLQIHPSILLLISFLQMSLNVWGLVQVSDSKHD